MTKSLNKSEIQKVFPSTHTSDIEIENQDLYNTGCIIDNKVAYLQFSISDTGVGIAPEKLPHLFEASSSDQTGVNWDGTGLGLPICKKILTELNGFIEYGSVKNKYTLFRLSVPFISMQSCNE